MIIKSVTRVTSSDIDNLLDADAAKIALRREREKVFKALDVYDKNVLRGREYEDAYLKTEIDDWRDLCLNLDDVDAAKQAIYNPPNCIQKYMPKV